MSVPGGLVHHWVGSTFIAGVTLNDALEVSSRYDDYPSVYKPIVVSTSLSHNENTYRVLMRIKAAAGGFSASSTSRRESNPTAAASTASRTRRRYGSCAMPESGYLWRAAAFTHMVERDGGVFVEMETIGLSRGLPTLSSWIIEPVAHGLGRSSVERSLQEFSMAVRTRSQA